MPRRPAIADGGGRHPIVCWYRKHIFTRRDPDQLFIFDRRSTLGLTIWRKGAVSLQFHGRFIQVVFGDWWKAMS